MQSSLFLYQRMYITKNIPVNGLDGYRKKKLSNFSFIFLLTESATIVDWKQPFRNDLNSRCRTQGGVFSDDRYKLPWK